MIQPGILTCSILSFCLASLQSANFSQDIEREVRELIAELPNANRDKVQNILYRLEEIGPEARDAYTPVLDLCNRDDLAVLVHWNVSYTLAAMGGELVPELRELVQRRPSLVVAVTDLMSTDDALPLVTDLIPLLEHPDQDTRYRTTEVLARFADDSDLVVPALLELFERQADDDYLCYLAVRSLGSSCAETKATLPRLIRLYKETSDNTVKDAIVYTVVAIDSQSHECLQILIDGLDNYQLVGPWSSVRDTALEQLVRIGSHAAPAKSRLLEMLNKAELSGNSRHYRDICTVLANINATDALPLLREDLAQTGDPGFVLGAVTAIGRLDLNDETAIDSLIEILNQRTPPPQFRSGKLPEAIMPEEAAAYGLGLIGPRAAKAIPSLQNAMKSEDHTLSRKAAWAIARIEPKDTECVEVLKGSYFSYPDWEWNSPLYGESPQDVVRVLGDRMDSLASEFIEACFYSESDRDFMVEVIAQLDKHIPRFLERAMELIADPGDEISRDDVRDALSALGARAAPGMKKLVEYVGADNHLQRAEAARMLGLIKQSPQEVIPKLCTLLDDPRVLVRARAVTALGRFGADAKSALPSLQNATTDKYYFVRESAKIAIRAIDE